MEPQTNTCHEFLLSLNQKIGTVVAFSVRLKERLTPQFLIRRSSAGDIETRGGGSGVEVPPPSSSNRFSGILITLCFTSAVETLLLFLQLQDQQKHDRRGQLQYFPVSFHLFSLSITCAFATTFVQKFVVGPNRARLSDLLNKIGKMFFATAFFLAMIIPSPMWLRIIYAVIFFVTLLVVSIA